MNAKILFVIAISATAAASGIASAAPAKPTSRWQWHAALSVSTRSRVDDMIYGQPSLAGSINVTKRAWAYNLSLLKTGDSEGGRIVSRLGATYTFPAKAVRLNYAVGVANYRSGIPLSSWQKLTLSKRAGGVDFSLALGSQGRDFNGNRNLSTLQAGVSHRFTKNLGLSAGLISYDSTDRHSYQSRYVSATSNLTQRLSLTATLSSNSPAWIGTYATSTLSLTLSQRLW